MRHPQPPFPPVPAARWPCGGSAGSTCRFPRAHGAWRSSGWRAMPAGSTCRSAMQAPRLPLPPVALALTTDSRHLAPAHAAQQVQTMVGALVGVTNAVWYKKIDSTLRGNLGSELDALLDTLGQPCALVCPAFPAHGRGLLDGRLMGAPVQPVHLPSLLAHQSQRAVAALPLAPVRAGSECLAAHMAEMRARRAQ